MTEIRVSNGERSFSTYVTELDPDVAMTIALELGVGKAGATRITASLPKDVATQLGLGEFLPPCVDESERRHHPSIYAAQGIMDRFSQDVIAKMSDGSAIPSECINCIANTVARIAEGSITPVHLPA